jgi:hypothetical protein
LKTESDGWRWKEQTVKVAVKTACANFRCSARLNVHFSWVWRHKSPERRAMMQPTSRREFFKRAGQLGLAGGVGALLTQNGCAPGEGLPFPFGNGTAASDGTGSDQTASSDAASGDQTAPSDTTTGDQAAPSAPAWPWPYTKLDTERVRKLGHQGFYAGDCCYGAFAAIVGALAADVGEPFTSIPTDMMRYGKGGVYGYGTLCGALNGAAAAIQLVCDEATASKVITELMNWYAATPLPTDVANQYAVNHEYLVAQLKTDAALPQNAAGDVLCHVSVSKWCALARYGSGSEQRKERCARLAGDVAAKAVELLNAVNDLTFQPVLKSPGELQVGGCMACHKPGPDYAAGNMTQGKMNCSTCHVDPVIPPVETHAWLAGN